MEGQASKEGQLLQQLNLLGANIEKAHHMLEELEKALDPVLREETPGIEAVPRGIHGQVPGLVERASRVEHFGESVTRLAERIHDIHLRLEI